MPYFRYSDSEYVSCDKSKFGIAFRMLENNSRVIRLIRQYKGLGENGAELAKYERQKLLQIEQFKGILARLF